MADDASAVEAVKAMEAMHQNAIAKAKAKAKAMAGAPVAMEGQGADTSSAKGKGKGEVKAKGKGKAKAKSKSKAKARAMPADGMGEVALDAAAALVAAFAADPSTQVPAYQHEGELSMVKIAGAFKRYNNANGNPLGPWQGSALRERLLEGMSASERKRRRF